MNIWLVDHLGFFNRGCEAIVRSTTAMLRSRLGPCRLTLWSKDADADRAELEGEGIEVRDAGKLPLLTWEFPYRLYGGLKSRGWPGVGIARALARKWPTTPRCVLSVGGDNFSLDYGRPARRVELGRFFLDLGVPYVIWGASVGPFADDPEWEQVMRDFLPRVDLITAREGRTVEYLRSLGVTANVRRVWDPAFALEPEPYAGPEAAFVAEGNVLGLNLSALLIKWLPDNDLERMLVEAARFVEDVLQQGMRVLLVPHVSKPGGRPELDDQRVLKDLLERCRGDGGRVALLPAGVPAAQLKWIISRCRFFIGARTHATIAAVSTGVPTIAVAYSQKAHGIWEELFGDRPYLVPARDLSSAALAQALGRLRSDEPSIRRLLQEKRETMLEGAAGNAGLLAELLGKSRPGAERPITATAGNARR